MWKFGISQSFHFVFGQFLALESNKYKHRNMKNICLECLSSIFSIWTFEVKNWWNLKQLKAWLQRPEEQWIAPWASGLENARNGVLLSCSQRPLSTSRIIKFCKKFVIVNFYNLKRWIYDHSIILKYFWQDI